MMDINLNILVIRFDGSVYKVKNGTGVFRSTRIYFKNVCGKRFTVHVFV